MTLRIRQNRKLQKSIEDDRNLLYITIKQNKIPKYIPYPLIFL